MPPIHWLTDHLPVRRRLGTDPLHASITAGARYTPVPIDRLKVTGNLAPSILARRRLDEPFTIDRGKRLAVVLPFRDREAHLAHTLPRIRQALETQGIDYRIVIVEQAPGQLFSRAQTINIGTEIAGDAVDYFCFHDVDMYPEAAEYGCPSQPLRLVKRFSTTFRRQSAISGCYFSGAIAIRRDQFLAANGFDNGFRGHGSQDEDFFLRCLLAGLVPYEDTQGVFGELDNPVGEESYRRNQVRKRNKRKMIWQCYRRRIGQSGVNNLQFRLLDRRDDGRVARVLVDPQGR